MTVLIFVAVLVLLIVGHELGHFVVAKLSKMRVDEFGIGFPPKIFGKKIGETEYTVNWLPFGGFVKIFGEDAEGEESEPRAFNNRPACLQAATLVAGPFANIVLAFVLSSVAFMIGAPAVINSVEDTTNVSDARVLIGEVLSESPAELAGIIRGDEIVSLDISGQTFEVSSSEEVSEAISGSDGALTISVLRNGEELEFPVEAVPGLIESDQDRMAIGVATALIGTVSYPPHIAIWKGLIDTGRDFVFILISLVTLIGSALTFSADVSNIAGPVGIASLTGEAAAFGLGSLLSFAALLSINLAIINILPFPALDGGRLLFLGIETVTRRKIPTTVAQTVNAGGFLVLILLMVAVTIGDISRLFG